jgi:hypothetical protein
MKTPKSKSSQYPDAGEGSALTKQEEKAVNDAKAGMLRLKNTLLHVQLHVVLKALLEARGWSIDSLTEEHRDWLIDKLSDAAIPLLNHEAFFACYRNGLPHEGALEDFLEEEVFDTAVFTACDVMVCEENRESSGLEADEHISTRPTKTGMMAPN